MTLSVDIHSQPPQGDLVLRDITKTLDGHTVLDQISLEVGRAEYFVLLGPSGVGKSTLLKIIAGHGSPSNGEIFLCGSFANGLPPAKRPTSLMFQEYSLFDHLSSWENVLFPLRVQRKLSESSVVYAQELAATAGLTQRTLERKPSEISGGERQRVALVRALVWRPRILLLDEPLASVDPSLRSELRILLRSLTARSQSTTVHVTHSLDEALELGDRIAVLLGGRIAQVGTPTDLYSRPASLEVASFLGYVCVTLCHERVDAANATPHPKAKHIAVAPTHLRALSPFKEGPTISVRFTKKVLNPDGSGEQLLMEYQCSATHRLRTVRLPLKNGDSSWRPGETVVLSADWRDAVVLNDLGQAVG